MFTGLIEAVGRIEDVRDHGAERRLTVATPLAADLHPGDSIATNGVCLTVTTADRSRFSTDISPATMRVTSLASVTAGRTVNLERPLKAGGQLGGHFVLGHVDGIGRVAAIRQEGESHWIDIAYPEAFAGLLIPKGSVAVDGVSLTVAALEPKTFGVQLIPFTWEHTSLKYLTIGDPVNLEGDVLGKYVARFMELRTGAGAA